MTEPGMTTPDSTLLRTAAELTQALDRLDQAAEVMTGAMRKSDGVTRRMQPLIKLATQKLSLPDQDKLNALTGRQTSLQRTVIQSKDTVTSAHTAFLDCLARARQALEDQTATIDGLHQRLARQTRLQAAMRRALLATSDQYLRSHVKAFEHDGFDLPQQSHSYIQSDLPSLFEMMLELDTLLASDSHYAQEGKRYRSVRFLEVGSGPRRNLQMIRAAKVLDCEDLTGFDINHVMIEAGKQAYGLADNLIVADALTFDYAPYDVVFSFRPFADLDLQQELEARMATTMHPGTYLLAPLPHDLSLYPDLEPRGSIADIWRKAD